MHQKIQRVTAHGIHLPDIAIEEDREYNYSVGLVLKIGADANKGTSFPSGAYCKVGDWVLFLRGSSLQAKYEASVRRSI